MFHDKLQRLKETLIFRYVSITVSYLLARSKSLLLRHTNNWSHRKIFLIPVSKPGKTTYGSCHNLILSGLGFQREKKKDFPVGRFISRKHNPLHSNAQRQIMVITLLEQTVLTFLPKTVASLLLQPGLGTMRREEFC